MEWRERMVCSRVLGLEGSVVSGIDVVVRVALRERLESSSMGLDEGGGDGGILGVDVAMLGDDTN